ncbi:hypothetical protein CDIK_3741 [Cucumispora dikerogammari]|nr:hypothetical protein CDIK_3741 [Cucumispora dikerogammari]
MTSNAAESTKSALKKFINNDIISFIVNINNYCSKKIYDRSKVAISGATLPIIQKRILNLVEQDKYLNLVEIGKNKFLFSKRYLADIEKRTCECPAYRETSISCVHFCCVLYTVNGDANRYVSKYFSKEYYEKTYSLQISVITTKERKTGIKTT